LRPTETSRGERDERQKQNTAIQAGQQVLIDQSWSSISTSNLRTFAGWSSGRYVILNGRVTQSTHFPASASSKNVKTFALKVQFLARAPWQV
jgi:hypothetical protein